jgi:hypothetical protein
MYKTTAETVQFMEEFKGLVKNSNHCDIVIAPPFHHSGRSRQGRSRNSHWDFGTGRLLGKARARAVREEALC